MGINAQIKAINRSEPMGCLPGGHDSFLPHLGARPGRTLPWLQAGTGAMRVDQRILSLIKVLYEIRRVSVPGAASLALLAAQLAMPLPFASVPLSRYPGSNP